MQAHERDDLVRERLMAFVSDWTRKPRSFDWAASNCCHFGSDWIESAEGSRPIRYIEETPSALAATRVCARHGGLVGAVSYALQREPIAATDARIGDIVLIPPERRIGSMVGVVGISAGDLVIVRAGESVTMLHANVTSKAWRVRCGER